MKKNKNLFPKIFIVFCINFLFMNNLILANEFKIVLKIDNSIITNEDIINEYNYLIALNEDLNKIKKEETLNIAKESLIKEKIKKIEIEKYIKIESFNRDELINQIIKNIYTRLKFENILEFENYLNTFGLSLTTVKEKLKIEIMWNQLIAEKYKSQITVNKEKIRDKVLKEKINYKNLIEYDLSEIVFSAKNMEELSSKENEIKSTIQNISFETAANKFSISDTSNLGGNIGKINENQLSKKIKNELKKIDAGKYTKPINIGNNFIILKVNKKNLINLKLDENEIINKMVEVEKKKQYENFSLIYYNKIKLNSIIDEL